MVEAALGDVFAEAISPDGEKGRSVLQLTTDSQCFPERVVGVVENGDVQ